MLSVVMLSVVMLSVFMLIVFMVSVVMLSVIMLIVRGPFSAVSYTQCMQTHRAECDRKNG
jgi:hypothetical protein